MAYGRFSQTRTTPIAHAGEEEEADGVGRPCPGCRLSFQSN